MKLGQNNFINKAIAWVKVGRNYRFGEFYLDKCESRLNNKDVQTDLLTFETQEMDLYEEVKDINLKILDKEYKMMDSDPNLRESRKYHVLKSIIQGNEKAGNDEEIKALLREILNKDGSFNGAKRRQLNYLVISNKNH